MKSEIPNPQSPIPIPPSLDCPEFQEAWAAWVAHREAMIGGRPLSAKRAKQEMSKVVCWGRTEAVAALRHSVRMGFLEIWPASDPGIPAKEMRWMAREAREKLRRLARQKDLPELIRNDLEDFR
jgi:hypothetical protein